METEVIWTFKPIGWTPKDCILYLKKISKYEDKKLSFAGRLDPMAYGLLPIIADDIQNQKQLELINSYKTYQFKFIPNLQSDTYDILGIVNKSNNFTSINLEEIKNMKKQNYPAYSSYCVFDNHYNKKVPLWKLAKENRLPEVMPERDIDIQNIEILSSKVIDKDKLLDNVYMRLDKLLNKSGFRYDEILNCWKNLELEHEYEVYHLEATVSSGTYIRGISNSLGGVAYDIFRTKVKDKCINPTVDPFEFKIFNIRQLI